MQTSPIFYIGVDGDGTVWPSWPTREPLPPGYHENLETFSQLIGFGNEGSSPKIGFCTGREINYTIGATRSLEPPNCWSILENGLYLYNLATNARINHPFLTQEVAEAFQEIRSRIIPAITFRFPILKEYLTKEVHIALERLTEGIPLVDLVEDIQEMLSEFADFVDVTSSSHAIDILVKGVNKGAGMLEMCKRTGVAPEQILIIGDSANDIPAMELAGYVACPENALPECKEFVRTKNGYVSPRSFVIGVVDAIEHYISQNA